MKAQRLAVSMCAVAAVGAGVQPSAAATNTVLTNEGNDFQVRPSLIGYTGDSTGYFGRRTWGKKRGYVKWQKWGSYSARGVGTLWLNNCRPSCAAGGWSSRKARIQLGMPRNGRFTAMTLTFRRGNHMTSDTRQIRHIPKSRYTDGYWIWTIVNIG